MSEQAFDWDAPWLSGVRVVRVGKIEKCADGWPGIQLWIFMVDDTAPPLSANDLVRMSEQRSLVEETMV